MKKRVVSLAILTTMFLGGQAVGIIPDPTAVVASANIAENGYVTATALNVRSQSNADSKILGTLSNNAKVTIVQECSNGWLKIRYKSGYGYVNGKYIKKQPISQRRQNIVNEAKRCMGVRYTSGGSTRSGFDCSGFTQYVMRTNGISINRTARGQVNNGRSVSKANLLPGDLVFFSNTNEDCSGYHVGIYVGYGNFIHASRGRGVIKSTLSSGYYSQHFWGGRRVA